MPQPEPDLIEIRRLLTESAWWAADYSLVDSRRMAAAAGFAWLAGARVSELARLTLADWLPDGADAVRLSPGEGDLLYRPRLIPVLPALRRLVAARLADMPGVGPQAFLLGRQAPWAVSPRGFFEQRAKAPAALTDGRVPSLLDLRERFRRYVDWDHADPMLAAWLAGSTRRDTQIRPDHVPDLRDLRRLLRHAHPDA